MKKKLIITTTVLVLGGGSLGLASGNQVEKENIPTVKKIEKVSIETKKEKPKQVKKDVDVITPEVIEEVVEEEFYEVATIEDYVEPVEIDVYDENEFIAEEEYAEDFVEYEEDIEWVEDFEPEPAEEYNHIVTEDFVNSLEPEEEGLTYDQMTQLGEENLNSGAYEVEVDEDLSEKGLALIIEKYGIYDEEQVIASVPETGVYQYDFYFNSPDDTHVNLSRFFQYEAKTDTICELDLLTGVWK